MSQWAEVAKVLILCTTGLVFSFLFFSCCNADSAFHANLKTLQNHIEYHHRKNPNEPCPFAE